MTDTPGSTAARPRVSVVVITYNHERFIRHTLESIVSQQAGFPFEVIVADDASTDATPDIVREIAARHPGVVVPVLREANIGIHPNVVDAMNRATGEFVALCEGDDYWIDDRKLARQVALLDADPAATVCFHPVQVIWDDDSEEPSVFPAPERLADPSLVALVEDNFIQTNSVVYRRRDGYDDVPDVMPLDWYLHVLHAATGRILVDPEVMSVYRRHPGGVWSDSVTAPLQFWQKQAAGHAAAIEAAAALLTGIPDTAEPLAHHAGRILGSVTAADNEDPAVGLLRETVAAHPQWATLGIRGQSAARATDRAALVDAQELATALSRDVGILREVLERRTTKLRTHQARAKELQRRVRRLEAELAQATGGTARERVSRLLRRLGRRD
ncbi:glycosyltransferase [Nocardioides kongjuensis]|uniref:Glycosyltransferase 2-like domain-containing protein n=1 Tax=Nocardioides kongjuensis TaxID=349522 RepID=A0A852RSM9_9ACTN|nr:hypothetical protein [Nocardioides kongjuensis]